MTSLPLSAFRWEQGLGFLRGTHICPPQGRIRDPPTQPWGCSPQLKKHLALPALLPWAAVYGFNNLVLAQEKKQKQELQAGRERKT